MFLLKKYSGRRLLEWDEEKFKNIIDNLWTDGQTYGKNNVGNRKKFYVHSTFNPGWFRLCRLGENVDVAVNTILVRSSMVFIFSF